MSGPVWILDVCGTLFRQDTTLGLLRHHFERRRLRGRALALASVTERKSPVLIAFKVLEKLSGRHLVKHAAIRLLAGQPLAELQQSAETYADELLDANSLAPVWQVLDERPANTQLILASSSLEPVVSALARRLGAEYVSSELEVRDGVLTGRLSKDLTGQKLAALRERFGSRVDSPARCITDNLTDRPLLERCAERFVVLHKDAHRGRWGDLDARYIGI